MKCPNCEVELPENSKFCAACGVKIENGETHSEGATNITTEESSKAVKTSVKEKVPEETIQSTATKLWNSLDLFYKVAAIVTFAISILLIVSICIGKAWPIVFSVLQLGGVVVAVLLHKNIIKLNYDWVKFVALGIVMLLTVFNIFSYSWGADNNRTQGDGTSQDVQKCDVSIRVECVQNLIFSKYDVKVLVDGDNQGKVEHGGDKDFAMKLIAGEHTITFRSSESSSVKGEVKLTVDCDTKAAYKISCHSDNVAVETLYVEQLRDLADNEAKVTAGASDYAYENYQEVKTAFESAGFTNIKCVAVYDIVWGLTEEESVESVSIGGNKDFKQGEIFAKDAEVVITYHMRQEDDPTRVTEKEIEATKSTESNPQETTQPSSATQDEPVVKDPNITIDNNDEFAALMKITDQTDAATISKFANAYKGKVIEFDGCVAFMMQHGNYKTRFDVCLANGDYEGRVYGPLFSFEDVNFYEMHVTGTDTVAEGMLFRIAGEIKGYNAEGGYIILEPVFMKAR